MRARIPQTIQRLRPFPGGHRLGRSEWPEAAPPAEVVKIAVLQPGEPADPEARVREAGGPDDRAIYTCSCGLVFQAPVSTSVACPHCGCGQAW